jgi:carbonic anhydrase
MIVGIIGFGEPFMNTCRYCRAVLLALTLSAVSLIVLNAAQEAHPPHWAYEGTQGPKEWGNLDSSYATCSVGRAQSPIDIKGAKKAELPALSFSYQAVPLDIIDNAIQYRLIIRPAAR